MENQTLTKQHETKTVTDLVHLYENGMLNLSPAFQRRSVWALKDRRKLIDTVAKNYPLPAIFLHRQEAAGKLCYSVIDGKQRLETLLGFLGYLRGEKFDALLEVPGMDGQQKVSATTLKRNNIHKEKLWPHFMGYRVPVIEVAGPLSDIIELFVRINSTGKALTPQEKRKAKYSGSPLLVEATRVANKFASYWKGNRIISAQQIERMKHVEFAAELLVTMASGDVINKKTAVDRVFATSSMTSAAIKKASAKTVGAINHVKSMFPELHTARFKQLTDYYSLVVLVSKLVQEGAVLADRARNRLAWDLLKAFGVEVDKIRELQRKLQPINPDTETYREYLLTVSQMTDDVSQRRRREQILRGLIGSIFARKDDQRGFTPEQRRILWSTSAEKECTQCQTALNWADFTIDHIDPYSKGGKSDLENAVLMCRSCNSAKGSTVMVKKKSAVQAVAR